MFLQEVSLKSHRSIINYPFGEFMSRKAGIKVEKCLLFQLTHIAAAFGEKLKDS